MKVDFTSRLNLLTGDNGLGKTFILDVAWWVQARKWADLQALTDADSSEQPEILSKKRERWGICNSIKTFLGFGVWLAAASIHRWVFKP